MNDLRRLITFFTANALFASGLAFHAFLYNFYLEGLDFSPAVMGRAAATWSLGGLLALLPAGRSVDRWGPKPVIIVAAITAAAGLAWSAVVTGPLTIYVASALTGAAGLSWRVAQAPVLMELSTTTNRSRLFTLDVAILVGVGAGSTALSGFLVRVVEPGWQMSHAAAITMVLVIGAVVTGASAFAYGLVGMAAPIRSTRQLDQPLEIPPRVFLLVFLSGLWLAGLTLGAPFFNIYFTRTFHLPIERVSWILSATTVATALLLTGAGELATKVGARRALAVWVALFAPAIWGLALAQSVGVAAAWYLVQNLISPAANPLLDQVLLESVPPGRRGVVSSWRQAMASGGQVLAQSLGGSILAAGSFAVLFGVSGGLALAAGSLLAWAAWRLNPVKI